MADVLAVVARETGMYDPLAMLFRLLLCFAVLFTLACGKESNSSDSDTSTTGVDPDDDGCLERGVEGPNRLCVMRERLFNHLARVAIQHRDRLLAPV